MKKKIAYTLAIICSVLYIYTGNLIATEHLTVFDRASQEQIQKAVVTKILDRTSAQQNIAGTQYNQGVIIRFEAKFLNGEYKGQTILALQNSDPTMPAQVKDIEAGDKILLVNSGDSISGEIEWTVADYLRSDALLVLMIIFFCLVLLFGRIKGINTILSLIFTCMAIFMVYIPAVLSGRNVYSWSVITCIFIIVMTMLILNGITQKSLAAGLGCASGTIVTGVITIIMDHIIQLTGLVDENSYYLLFLNQDNPIDLKGVVFGAIIIGAIGAIMDISMDITASLHVIASEVESPTFTILVKSGLTIGRDILGTMCNTLILAYIGSSLSLVLLLAAYNNSLLHLFNREMIVVEILQALVGSIGILFTIPLTSIICGVLYSRMDLKGTANNRPNKV